MMKIKYLKAIMCFLLAVLLVSCSVAKKESSVNHDSFHEVHITFPANEREQTEFNSYIYDIEPFQISCKLPEGWEFTDEEENGDQPGQNAFLRRFPINPVKIRPADIRCRYSLFGFRNDQLR